MTEDFVKQSVIKYLSTKGWGYFKFDKLHTHGVDIRAKKANYSRYLFVETKGGEHDEVNFVYSLGQIVTRMKDGGKTRNYYAIALPNRSASKAIRRLPWQVAKKLLLYVFSVNEKGEVTEYSWKELKAKQES